MPYINLHTHLYSIGNELFVYNTYPGHDFSSGNGIFSCGIHPLKINEATWKQELLEIKSLMEKKKIIALGECGFDKRASVSMTTQEAIFEGHIHLALEFHVPLIVHCVKAHSMILPYLKKHAATLPFIFHGYNQAQNIFMELMKHRVYFSFGKALIYPNSNATLALKQLPISNIFLETDDAELNIEEVYAAAANALKVEEGFLVERIMNNFAEIFNYSFHANG